MTKSKRPPVPVLGATSLDTDIRRAAEFRERQRVRRRGFTDPPKPIRRKAPTGPRRSLQTHLIIGDSHAHPDDPNWRFEALGKLIQAVKPNVVIDIGDSADMASLFGYEQGNKGPLYEGRAYWQDIEAYIDAKERLKWGMGPMNPMPRLVKLDGNHEYRIEKLLMSEPRFRGVIGVEDLMDAELGWERYPFLESVEIDQIAYCHYWKNIGGERAVAGVMPTRSAIQKRPGSYSRVCGHSHRLEVYEEMDGHPNAQLTDKITSWHAGCYFDLRSNAHRWARDDVKRWRNGILQLGVDRGQVVDFTWWDYWQIQKAF